MQLKIFPKILFRRKADLKAIILAGGVGSRLMPVTAKFPKPLAPIAGKPCLFHTLDLLKKNGVTEIIATVRHGSAQIRNACADRNLVFIEEKEPLGTAGGVKACEGLVDGDFLVVSGDAVTDIDLCAAVAFHKGRGGAATVVLSEVGTPFEYGVCLTDDDGRITELVEKPGWERAYSGTVNTGIYVFSREIFDFIEYGKAQDFAKDVFPRLIADGKKIYGYRAAGYWRDIGSVRSYLACNADALAGRVGLELPENGKVAGAIVHEPCFIGKNVSAAGAVIGPYSVIGDGCILQKGCRIERSVLLSGVCVGENSVVRNSAVCDGVKIRDGVSVCDGAAIGDGCAIGSDCVIGAGVGIAPDNIIPKNTVLTTNVTGAYKPYKLERSAADPIGDITSFARLGAAFGCLFRGNAAVGYEDAACAAQLHAIISGILSSADNVLNLGCCQRAQFRYTVRAYSLCGGIYAAADKIYLYAGDGLPLSTADEKALRKVFEGNEFFCGKSGNYRMLKNYGEPYVKKLRRSVVAMRPVNMRIYGDDILSEVIPTKTSESAEHIYVGNSLGVDEYPERLVKCCVSIAFGKTFGKVCVPYSYPSIIEKLGERGGFEVHRLTLDSPDRDGLYDITDPNICACVLCGHLSRSKKTFARLAASVPSFDVFCRDVDCDGDKFEVMRRLSEGGGEKEFVEGIRFIDREKKWNVRVVPKNDAKGFRIVAEAANSETAEEMCDFYVKKIRCDKNSVDKNE